MTQGDRTKITQAFRKLRAQGYTARQNFACCQTCAWAEIGESKADRAVFYHRQDAAAFARADRHLMLAWSGDKLVICRELEAAGLTVVWPLTDATRIKVLPSDYR